MNYEWDSQKRLKNLLKHGIEFSDAVMVFEDDFAITVEDPFYNEERFVTVGRDAYERVLVIVYTHREDVIRIISARKANKTERHFYEEGKL
jgi:uncharacterized DUF497 family protein